MAKESGNVKHKLAVSANLAIYTLVVIAIVVVANWFVNGHDKHWDLTPNKTFSLSPETQKMLKGLDRDVAVYVFDRKESLREGRDILENYAHASRHVTVRYVDPDREPGLAKQFGVRSYGTVVVASGDKHYESQGGATEEGVTNALIHVLHGQKTLYFVEGHGERDINGTERQSYSTAKKQLENENMQVKAINLLEKNEVPADCSVLVIAGPQKDYQPQEVDVVRKYVSNGGRLLIMLDPAAGPQTQNPDSLAKLLSEWNVTVDNDLVIENGVHLMGAGPGLTVVRKYGSSPIVQPLKDTMTLFPYARSFVIGKESKPGVTDSSLCETSPDSYGFQGFGPQTHEVAFRQGKDQKGPLTVAVSGEIASTAPGGASNSSNSGRFVAFGTSALASNVYYSFGGNGDLFMSSVGWLASEADLISVRPKPPASQRLNMTQRQMSQLLFLGVIGLPLIILLAGVTVWWGRR